MRILSQLPALDSSSQKIVVASQPTSQPASLPSLAFFSYWLHLFTSWMQHFVAIGYRFAGLRLWTRNVIST